MNRFLSNIYVFVKIFMIIVICILLCIPCYYIIKLCKDKKKQIKIFPKFEIIEITNEKDINIETTSEIIRLGQEMLQRAKKS
jgi:hypothetical protein